MKKTNEKLVVLGIFKSISQAESSVDYFRAQGFRAEDISALLPSGDQTKEFAHEKGTKAPEGMSAGGATGIVLGGALGWLAGVGSLAIPGVGPLIAAGPIMATLAGAGIGATMGAVTGGLVGMGFPEYEAKRYEGQIKSGGILVSVHCDDSEWERKAKEIFKNAGATDISSTSEASADTEARSNLDSRRVGNY